MSLKERAIQFATAAHAGQVRKLSNEPYIVHPLQVAKTLEEAGFCEELVIAALLHDTVEDTDTTIEQIEKEFGPKVAHFVSAHTEDKTKTWEERKQHTLDLVKDASLEVKALIVADKWDNLKSMTAGHELMGDKIWSCFKRGLDSQEWYIRGVAMNSFYGINDNEIPQFFHQYVKDVNEFFESINHTTH
jgi:(p)ppGpp synthase/HD superfamily hydrolase